MVSKLKPKNAYLRYMAELHQWLPSYLEVTENAGQARFKRLLEFFDLNSSGSRVVLDAVKQFANATKDECVDSIVDATEAHRVDSVGEIKARWEAVKNALYESLPSENKLAPETQLVNLKRASTENLLEFVMRYRRLAEEFTRASKISDDRALQILYRKLPIELQRLMTTMNFSTTTLNEVELIVRNRMDWMAVSTPGAYNKRELGDYMDIDTLDVAPADAQSIGLNAIRDKLFTDGRIQFDQVTNENAVMVVWKELMKRPKYRREAERFLASNKGGRKPNGAGPSSKPTVMAHEVVASDEDEVPPFGSQFQDEVEAHLSQDLTEHHCHLSILPNKSKPSKETPLEIMVCNRVRSIEKSSMHLPVKVGGHKIGALVDTGATTCFVQSKLVDTLKLKDHVKPCSSLVVMGNGVTEELMGKLLLEVTVDDQSYPLDAFIIKGKGPPLIFGYRFLCDHNLVVDCRHKTLHRRDGSTLQCHSLNSPKKTVKENDVSKDVKELKAAVELLASQVGQLMEVLSKNFPESLLIPAQQ